MATADDDTPVADDAWGPAVPSEGPDVPPDLMDRVERALIGGPRKYTRADTARLAGISADDARALWRALGFGIVDDGDPVFVDADVEALREVRQLAETSGLDEDSLRSMTRAIGQAFARLASWQGQLVLDVVAQRPELAADPDAVVELLDAIVPLTERLHGYIWRRQLDAYFARIAATSTEQWADDERPGAVGFVDMAGFTSLTRRADKHELQQVLERFESLTGEVVGAHHGQVVKLIGDEVLFLADESRDAAGIALQLVAAAEDDDVLPQLRGGLAAGPVVRRLGDVFGSTVNIAARLTSLARPGTVLVDRTMAEQLRADETFALKQMRPESVRGYHRLHPWRLRSASAARR